MEADAERLPDDQGNRMHGIHHFQLGSAEKFIGAENPRHALQEKRGLANFWNLDDGDILCHPMLEVGGERNQQKTEVINCVSDLDTAPPHLKINEVRPLASVDTTVHENVTLGVAVGSCRCVTDQPGKIRRHPGHA